jgi:hypothetical protein
MRATIVADDGIVIVDGKPHTVDCSPLIEDGNHAVQWSDSFGEVEYRTDPETGNRAPNERITDFSPYQPYVDLWEAEEAKSNIHPELNSIQPKSIAAILGV